MPGPASDPNLHVRVDTLERSLDELEEQFERVEDQLRANNALLDNISRESARTNVLLEGLVEQWSRQQDREDRREEANRAMVHGAAREVWDTFKHPLAYALMALATWMAVTMGVPDKAPDLLPEVVEEVAP